MAAMANASAVWNRVIDPNWIDLEPEAARSILRLKFTRSDQARIRALGSIARAGKLTDAERGELDFYLHVGGMRTIMHSKARRALKRFPARSRARRTS